MVYLGIEHPTKEEPFVYSPLERISPGEQVAMACLQLLFILQYIVAEVALR